MNASSLYATFKSFFSKLIGSRLPGWLTSLLVLLGVPAAVKWMHRTYCTLRYGEASVKAGEHKLTFTGWMVGLGLLGLLLSPVIILLNAFIPFIPWFWALFLFGSLFLLVTGLALKALFALGRGVYKLIAFVGRVVVGMFQKKGSQPA